MDKIILSVNEDMKKLECNFWLDSGYERGAGMLMTALARLFRNCTGCDEAVKIRLRKALGKTLHQFEKEVLR